MDFNIINLLLVLVVLLSVLNGWRRGFIRGVLDLFGLALSLLAGLRFYLPVAHWLGPRTGFWPDVLTRPVAFLLVAGITCLAVNLLSYALQMKLPRDVHKRRINKV